MIEQSIKLRKDRMMQIYFDFSFSCQTERCISYCGIFDWDGNMQVWISGSAQ